jgi:hypothetical protein
MSKKTNQQKTILGQVATIKDQVATIELLKIGAKIINRLQAAAVKTKDLESIIDSGNQIPQYWMDEIKDHQKLTGKPSIEDYSELLEKISRYNSIIIEKTPTSSV